MKVKRCNFRESFGKIAKKLCRFIESLKSHIYLNPVLEKNFRKLRTCQQVQLSQTQMHLEVQHKLPNSLCWEVQWEVQCSSTERASTIYTSG